VRDTEGNWPLCFMQEVASAAASNGILFSAEVMPTEAAKRDL
jgi:hypothetical protein